MESGVPIKTGRQTKYPCTATIENDNNAIFGKGVSVLTDEERDFNNGTYANFWGGGIGEAIVIDLGYLVNIQTVYIRNSHNAHGNSRYFESNLFCVLIMYVSLIEGAPRNSRS